MGGREISEDNSRKRSDSEGCGESEQMSKEKEKKGTCQCGALVVFVRRSIDRTWATILERKLEMSCLYL
jgi:hypothetical protein